MKRNLIFICLATIIMGSLLEWRARTEKPPAENEPFLKVEKRSFPIIVRATGELETARSTAIFSTIRGDFGKILFLIPDGSYVQPEDLLVKIDSTPFEEKVEKLKTQIQEGEGTIIAFQHTLEWEKTQAFHEQRSAEFEQEAAHLELEKLIYGDGPVEIAKLKSSMQKVKNKYEELVGYAEALQGLQNEGFLHPSEIKQTEKKLLDERESYENSKSQYESYLNHAYPMQVKKLQAQLKKAELNREEKAKGAAFRIAKAQISLAQAQNSIRDLQAQLREAERELALTEIKAPAPGMVVHREDFRAGQRRKPRIGDIPLRNQPLLDLPDLDAMIVKAKVREVDLSKVTISKKSTVYVDAFPDYTFPGEVTNIGILALSEMGRHDEEKYFEVRIALRDNDRRLRPGMTARAVIHVQEIENQLAIPTYAVFEENEQQFCYVSTGYGYERRPLKLGVSSESWVQVDEGLQEGEKVCLINPFEL